MSDKHPSANLLPEPESKSKAGNRAAYVKATKTGVLVFVIVVLTVVASAGAVYAISQNKILPNVRVAGYRTGLADKLVANQVLQEHFDSMIEAGLEVELKGQTKHLDLRPTAATDPDLVYQIIDWDASAAVDRAYAIGHSGNQLRDFFAPLYHLVLAPVRIEPDLVVAETRFFNAIGDEFPEAESTGQPTDFVFTGSDENLNVTVTEAVEGSVIDTHQAINDLKTDAYNLSLGTLKLNVISSTAVISKNEAETLIPEALAAVGKAPYVLVFEPEYGDDLIYTVTADNLKTWLLPVKDENGEPEISLDADSMEDFLLQIHSDIDIAPQDAKFVLEGDRVIEFEESRDGFVINDDTLLNDLQSALGTDDTHVAIATERTEPELPTEAANDLGIKEVLGVGFSSYAGSPSNRRANIKHGASKLNGLLVPPGETLSLLEKLKPFTIEDGYLPELVIKGDKIIPEIGGGLCQIGTTTFRAALNSGLDIAERRNHSLVVSYYNDPANGNPGTDATIYDPAPDLKIVNDTGHYIMLITDVDETKNELHFTFWGTSDGREASYTPPVVLSWTGAGAAVLTETTALAPGEKSCQAAHPGATTTFDYNIVLPDGTTKTRSFFSSYRSLPQVCLVGVAEGGGGDPVESAPGDVEGVSDEPLTDEEVQEIVDG